MRALNRTYPLLTFLLLFCSVVAGAQTATLDDYIQKGIHNNPQLNDYRNQIQSGQTDSLKINASRKPQINLLGQILVAPIINGYGYDQAVTNNGNYELLVGVSQNLFNKQILAPQYENIRLQNQSNGQASAKTEHDLRKDITTLYIQAYADNLQVDHALATLRLLKEENLYLEKLVENGIYKPFDYSAFQVTLQAQEIIAGQQKFAYRSDIYALNLLCGINDTAIPVLAAPQIQPKQAVDTRASLFMMTFHIDSLVINNRKFTTGANYKPKLSWFADGGILSSQPSTLYRNFGTSFGLNLSVPLYDGRQKNLEFKKISLAENTRSMYQSYFKTQFETQRESLLAELKGNTELIAQTNKQLKLTESQIELGKSQLNIGALPVSDFLLAIRSYREVQNSLSLLQIKQLQLINELNYWNW